MALWGPCMSVNLAVPLWTEQSPADRPVPSCHPLKLPSSRKTFNVVPSVGLDLDSWAHKANRLCKIVLYSWLGWNWCLGSRSYTSCYWSVVARWDHVYKFIMSSLKSWTLFYGCKQPITTTNQCHSSGQTSLAYNIAWLTYIQTKLL